MKPYYQDKWVVQYQSDALIAVRELEEESIDLLCTDPPYGIGFMGKDWDRALPDKRIWAECLRVLKPGAFAFVMSIPRADCLSRMIISLEDAGFNVGFSPIYHTFASGFPKALSVSKAVDKRNGRHPDNEDVRKYLGEARQKTGLTMQTINDAVGTSTMAGHWFGNTQCQLPSIEQWQILKSILYLDNRFDELIEREEAEREVIGKGSAGLGKNIPAHEGGFKPEYNLTISATPQAKALEGSYGGFQPKPAVEVIIVAMKPLSEKTFVDQALENGKGITWLDDCKIPYSKNDDGRIGKGYSHKASPEFGVADNTDNSQGEEVLLHKDAGRFPANLLVSDDVLNDGRVQKSGKAINKNRPEYLPHNVYGERRALGEDYGYPDSGSFSRYFDLDKWAQKTFPFLIVPKASKSEKNKGCEVLGLLNTHPTVKPLKLMSYLVTLGSREGDVVLDPFGGSGTTALASKLLGRKCIICELEEKYCEIAANRCRQEVMELKICP